VIRLAVRCRAEQAERVLAQLLELAPGGVEEEQGDGYVEYAIYGAEGELPDLGELDAAAGEGLVEVTATPVPDDWADRWRDFHRPILVGGRLWVRPSWETPVADPGAVDVVIDPGQAFGTGAHPTTRMCLELLLELADFGLAGGALADWGTGSGLLAIAAAKLGWSPVTACDHESAALEAAAANAKLNAVELGLERVNLRRDPPPLAPTVIANLTAPLLVAAAERLSAGGGGDPGAGPERLVCSGLLASEVDDALRAFAAAGLLERERRQSGDWAALFLAAATL
jgi:ribosomal protein L11 methyltransferase